MATSLIGHFKIEQTIIKRLTRTRTSMIWPMCVVDGVLACLCSATPLFSPYLALTCGSDSNWFSSTPAAAALLKTIQ